MQTGPMPTSPAPTSPAPAPTGVDAPTSPVPADVDALISWRESGAGPPVVFLHGLGGTRTSWEPQLADLCDTFRCVAWDMPGYGASSPVEPLTFPAVAAAVIELLDTLGAPRADLVGESFGGMHALHTAIGYPDRVGRLVLAGTSPAFGLDGTDAEAWKASRLRRIGGGETPSDMAADVLRELAGPGIEDSVMAMRVAGFARITATGFRAAVECLPTHDVRDRLAGIEAPTLVVVGGLDTETPVSYATALADGLASARLVVLDSVGHLAVSEAPALFNQLVRDFLTESRPVSDQRIDP